MRKRCEFFFLFLNVSAEVRMRPQDIFNEIVFIVSLDRLKEKKKDEK